MHRTCLATVGLATLGLASALLSSTAVAQQWGGQWSTSGGGQSWGQPAVMPRVRKVENIGRAGQLVFGVDRVTGLGFHHNVDNQTVSAAPAVGGSMQVEAVDTYSELGLFGASASGARALQAGPRNAALMPRLALDYLPMNGLTLGGSLMVLWGSGESRAQPTSPGPLVGARTETSSTLVVVHPRVGFAYPFNDTYGIWPRIGLAWSHTSGKITSPGSMAGVGDRITRSSYDVFALTIEAMFWLSPFKHFALLFGPYADIGFAGTGETKGSDVATNGAVTEADTVSHSIRSQSFGLAGSVVTYFP